MDWTPLERTTRWMVFQHFLQSGEAPPVARLARLLEAPEEGVVAALDRLARDRQLVLGAGGDIRFASPFSAEETGIRVEARGESYPVPCAWDALSLSALLGGDAVIEADPLVGRGGIRLEVRGGELLPTMTRIQFLVPVARFWDDIGFT